MNFGVAGFASGWNRQYTPEGQLDILKLQEAKQNLEIGKQNQELTALSIQQKLTEIQQQKAAQEADIAAMRNLNSNINSPVDSSGNVSKDNSIDASSLSPDVAKQIQLLNSRAHEHLVRGLPDGYKLLKEAEDIKSKAIDDNKKEETLKKEKLELAAQRLNSITDQDSLNRAILDSVRRGEDPRQLGLTGNWETDKIKITDIRNQVLSVKDKLELDRKERDDKLKQEKEDRAEKREKRMEQNQNRQYLFEREKFDYQVTEGARSEKARLAGLRNKYREERDRIHAEYNRDWLALDKESRDPNRTDTKGEVEARKTALTNQYEKRKQDLIRGYVSEGLKIPQEEVGKKLGPTDTTKKSHSFTPKQESWIERAMKVNPGMSRDEIIQEGKKRKKL